ncbi:carboxypeptidase-like regulatory domain-containing protein [Hymenobacter sp. BT770]|uniref:carboxypeptidase-like regulatory domain-containing protein n=1 Tax=Hymenobacter sp. BT770 TaxID=2886942 RepID=UPI001D11DEF4|nr:carboxypeptidase-like regulatory domain-containing protein [Hymenobacter sp. BT770]MCC3151622.1 carboxypeptidase-like regulatory domain-containing protein [Hymenobacter sp. BT770]MDO3413801.1 carboxypeptidase-like regulatory domain-containing protein [Hymenobacter sp. BT770]
MSSEVVPSVRGVWPKLRQWLGVVAALWLLAGTAQAQTQQIRVSGSVTAADTRQAVPGTTVQVQRTRRGVVTNATGDFAVDALPTDTILFRALGYKAQRLPLGGTGLSQLVVRIQLVRDSVRLGEVQVTGDRPDRAIINRALRNMKRPTPPVASGAKRPPKPKPLFAVDSTAPKAPVPTIASPVSLIYEQFSREGKQRRKMEEIEAAQRAEKARKARADYNKAFRDNRGYEP